MGQPVRRKHSSVQSIDIRRKTRLERDPPKVRAEKDKLIREWMEKNAQNRS